MKIHEINTFSDNIPFNSNSFNSDVTGEFSGMVLFSQNSIIPQGKHINGDMQPHLTANRKTMVLFKPEGRVDTEEIITLIVSSINDEVIEQYQMRTPEQLTRPVGHDKIVYGNDFWSAIIPEDIILPGMHILFECNGKSSRLDNIEIGAPSELIIHTIDLGMLTPYRGEFAFQYNPEYHRQYFHQIPVKKLIVSRYEPQYFREVMLPDGVLLKDFDPSEGGYYDGTMRQRIGKELISLGIDNANYGINSSEGIGEDAHPYSAAQMTAHNSIGKYVNGVVVHGLSGGWGMITLENSIGNEFSHEVGHNYGLGHYVGGFSGSIHRAAKDINSCWGWDSDKDFFIPNFEKDATNHPTCLDAHCAAPFEGHSFGRDAMADGDPLYREDNQFTLHPPYVLREIQSFFEGKVVFSAESSTGFKKWNSVSKKMEPWVNEVVSDLEVGREIKKPYKQNISVVTLVGYYDPDDEMDSYIYPALYGAFGVVYPPDGNKSDKCHIEVETAFGDNLNFKLANKRIVSGYMNKFHINIEKRLRPVKANIVINSKNIISINLDKPKEHNTYTVNGHNFIDGYPVSLINPSAESGDLSGWTLDKGRFRVIVEQDDIYADDGKYFFTAREGGDFSDEVDQISQVIGLDVRVVSLGKAIATLTFKSNGWGDGDYGVVSLIAKSHEGVELARAQIRSVHEKRNWVDNTISLNLPVDSVTLGVEVKAVRVEGIMSDVHFDNFILKIKRELPYTLQNPSAETGDLSGWTLDKGLFRVITEQDGIVATEGKYYFTARNGGDFSDDIDQISQEVALDTSLIMLGKATATLTFKSNGWGDEDYGVVSLIARDYWGDEIARAHIQSTHEYRKWVDNNVSLDLPIDAKTLLIEVKAVRVTGTVSDVHFDDFILNVERVLPVTLQNPSAETGDLSGWTLDKGLFRVITEQDGIVAADGEYYFTARNGGRYPDNIDQISQEIALDKSLIMPGKTAAILNFKSNGWGDGDYGEVSLIARSARGLELARVMVRSIHEKRKWVDNTLTLFIPSDAISLLIEVKAFLIAGAVSDVHFDDFVLNIDNSPEIRLQNPSAETGDLTGWTQDKGKFSVGVKESSTNSHDRYFFIASDEVGSSEDINQISQEVTLVADKTGTGKAVAMLNFKSNVQGDCACGQVRLIATSEDKNDSVVVKAIAIHETKEWVNEDIIIYLPSNAKKLRVEVEAIVNSHNKFKVEFEHFDLQIRSC